MHRSSPFLLLVFSVAGILHAEDRGAEIARKTDSLAEPRDRSSVGTMVITSADGSRRSRKMVMLNRRSPLGESSFVRILEPADVAGTKFLSLPLAGGETDQRLYLPALRKARKIASSGKNGDFVNSDLSFYDLEERVFSDYEYRFLAEDVVLPDEAFAGKRFFKLEMRPVGASSPYIKLVAYIDMRDYFAYRVEAFDRVDSSLWKVFTITKIETVKGMLIPIQTIVENRKRGSRTMLEVSELKVDTGLSADLFTIKKLEE